VDHADDTVYRLKPRYNPGVNDWWMCDEGRFGWKCVYDESRVTAPILRRGGAVETPAWESIPGILDVRFRDLVAARGADKVAAVISPMMACEEAWLLIRFIRTVAPGSTLVSGYVPVEGGLQTFPVGAAGKDVKFTIRREKCPNRRGVDTLVAQAGGNALAFDAFCEEASRGAFAAAWIAGGYPRPWVDKPLAKAAAGIEFLVVQDLLRDDLTNAATLVLPFCAFAEREGSYMNYAGRIQPFERAIVPPDGAKRDGQYLYEIAGYAGLYSPTRVREMMARENPLFAKAEEPPPAPVHAH
jgi:NADH-quinone oxidoreductase subunit G